jgi:autotransporter-associated beta strand protein
MADRYFDRNGATAGFGTLTGAWDTTTASWSTSNAGTATPATFTFTNTDAAFFGSSAVALTTAGTATISTGITVTLNGIYTRNLTAVQTVAAAGTGALAFAGTTPFVNLAQQLHVSAPVSGTSGINVTGTSQWMSLALLGASSGLSGAASVNSGGLLIVRTVPFYTPSSLSMGADTRFVYLGGTADYEFPVIPTGQATSRVMVNGAFSGVNGVTFPSGIGAFTGYIGARVQSGAGGNNTRLLLTELPGGLIWSANIGSADTVAGIITYAGNGESKASGIIVDSEDYTSLASMTAGTYSLLSSGTGPIVLSGAVTRTNSGRGTPGTSARISLTLGGMNTGNNTLSGNITEEDVARGAILGITKVDAGRWVLSGTNSHTGIHTISAGTLAANSATALGSATSTGGVSIIGTGVLELGDGVTLNKSVTDFTLSNATNPVQTAGTSTLQSKQVTLSVTPTFTVPSGRKLTIAPQGVGVISGSAGITKSGDGELELTAKANTFNGTVTVSAGTLTVGSVGNATPSPVAAAWGQASSAVLVSGTLKYNGGAGSSNRAVQMTGSAPTVDASGSGALTLSNVTQDTTAKTMTLRGTNTDANTVTNAIANNSGAVSLAKLDGGKWVLPGALSYTGTTTVSGGTLRVETANSNTTSGAVTIGASGTVELITDTLASSGATAGEVLGTGNVTVNGGTIKTRGGTTQKGQVRYGGNLTFGSGSTLYIGAAA